MRFLVLTASASIYAVLAPFGGLVFAKAWRYDIHYKAARKVIEISAEFSNVDALTGDPSSAPFLSGLTQKVGKGFEPLPRKGDVWTVSSCRESCVIRYSFAMGDALKKDPSLDYLNGEGSIHIVKPNAWLLRPRERSDKQDVKLRFSAEGEDHFASGLFPSSEKGFYQTQASHLDDLPWSILGPYSQHRLQAKDARVTLAIVPGSYQVKETEIIAWAQRAIDALVAFYGRYPVPHALVIVAPRNRMSGPGKSFGDGGAVTINPLSLKADDRALRNDWVMTHEMVHLALPSVPYTHHWLEEGLATYVEPIARIRSRELSASEVFRDMILGMPKGLPAEGDQSLDHTPTWGRTYWGGALFCLLADVELRERSRGKAGLDDALRAILDQGGSMATHWDINRVFEVADRGTGYPVLKELYEKMKDKPFPVDLDELWKKLGVELQPGGKIVFDDKAPLAFVRKGMGRTMD